jgi:beta-lactamase regulating signal transducer with metallopeptidase domain/predicted  nucleic acid-binding Zn-ribbon protein
MDTVAPLLLGSFKALVLLTAAAGLTRALRRRPARLRAVVWGTALAGALLIPLVAPLLPAIALPLPTLLADLYAPEEQCPIEHTGFGVISTGHSTRTEATTGAPGRELASKLFTVPIENVAISLLALGAAIMLARLGHGLWRMKKTVDTASEICDPDWLASLAHIREQLGCRRHVRLVASQEVDIPATVGLLSPVIVLPTVAATWPHDRRTAVLVHEMVHVARFDWPVRLMARVARAAYWFNPLAWWAVRRLDLELELACDEEVLALGTRPSNYACHLLGIARSVALPPTLATSGVGMARRTHLEERIMTMLKRTTHRRVGMSVLLPAAVLVAAMVPALAAVHPGNPQPRPASPEIKQILTEMEDHEERIEAHVKRIEALELEIQPQIEEIELKMHDQAMADIEERMRPHLERLEEIELDMEPLTDQIAALEDEMQRLEFEIEDGTIQDIERQIHEQLEPLMEQIKSIHIDMEPYHEQMEEIHRQMEPLHLEIEELHKSMEPMHREIEELHESMEPVHERMEEIHREMEPFHEEMEILHERLERAIRNDLVGVLREHLGAVTGPQAPFDEAASRLTEDAHIRVRDDEIRLDASPSEAREILSDLMTPHRVGSHEAFDAAIEGTVKALDPLVIAVE